MGRGGEGAAGLSLMAKSVISLRVNRPSRLASTTKRVGRCDMSIGAPSIDWSWRTSDRMR